jgi:dynein heavy chain
MVEEAFRLNVKWSLQELSRAINGDGKSIPNPLLKVKVVLEGDKVMNTYSDHNKTSK